LNLVQFFIKRKVFGRRLKVDGQVVATLTEKFNLRGIWEVAIQTDYFEFHAAFLTELHAFRVFKTALLAFRFDALKGDV
jgi:hypothetical protein